MKKIEESEFGKGFIYSLILFAKHFERCSEQLSQWEKMREKNHDLFTEEDAISTWFNGAGDHFYELEVPEQWLDKPIGKMAVKLQNRALKWRMEKLGNHKDFLRFFEELEKLTRMIDKELGIDDIQATWS